MFDCLSSSILSVNLVVEVVITGKGLTLPFLPCAWQKQVTVRYSVLEVLLEITKFCDLYLMERVLDDETEVRASLFISIILLGFCNFL